MPSPQEFRSNRSASPGGPSDPTTSSLSGDSSLALPEFDAPPADPLPLLQEWVADAFDRGVREPLAASLATVNAEGRPSDRVLLLKAIDADGLVFYGQHGSRKGRDLASVPFAAISLYWRETVQQVRASGPVVRLTDAESDALFASRLRTARAAATASTQSQPLDSPDDLRARFDAAVAGDTPIPRPDTWGGYRLVPEEIEFWHGNPDRLHRRLRYQRSANGWRAERLQP